MKLPWGGSIPILFLISALSTLGAGPINAQTETEVDSLLSRIERLMLADRYDEAAPLAEKYVDAVKRSFGEGSRRHAVALHEAGVVYHRIYRYDDAERLYKRSIKILEPIDQNDPGMAACLLSLATLYSTRAQKVEAEPLFKRVLAIREKAYGYEHPFVANDLGNLALFYHSQWRYEEAEPLYRRALAILEKVTPQHPNLAVVLNRLTGLYNAQGRYLEAEPLHRRAMIIVENALGPEHLNVAAARGALATHYHLRGRYAEAEVLDRKNLDVYEKVLGADHQFVAESLHNIASLYTAQGRYVEAEPLYRRALVIAEKALGAQHPFVARNLFKLAELYYAQRSWAEAVDHARQAVQIAIGRANQTSRLPESGAINATPFELAQNSYSFNWLIRAAWQHAQQHTEQQESLTAEAFAAAQWTGRTSAAAALSQMVARFAKGEGDFSVLVREQQNLSAAWQELDKQLVAMHSVRPESRNMDREQALENRLNDIDRRLISINARLEKDYPEYAALVSTKPLPIKITQQQLNPGEALVQFVFTGSDSFAWAVTKAETRWVKLKLDPKEISQKILALRCGLDASNWINPRDWPEDTNFDKSQKRRQSTRREQCRQLLGVEVSERDTPPFNLMTSFELYEALLEPFADLLVGKNLLLVLAGELANLPFHVLVDRKPRTAIPKSASEYREVSWLARRHAITVLPSVASLADLRERSRLPPAPRPYIAFGNPLLEGNPQNRDDVLRARKARRAQSCADVAPTLSQVVLGALGLRGNAADLFHGGRPALQRIRQQPPLPETADELCAIARELGALTSDVYLGASATEKVVKSLSADGSLASARVVHFATHGFLADELDWFAHGRAEPALVLTPPPSSTDPKSLEVDDGLLTASEVAQLKLNADWVVLSACNTAGGEKQSRDALSGLARAFFYAGARAILVSHWYVNSEAAVKLTTTAFSEIKADPKIGRAEALRRAMRSIFENGSNFARHPAYWGPFVVVGEGAE